MKKYLIIITPNNEEYVVNELGQIRTKQLSDFSPTWLFRGMANVKSNEFIPFAKITPGLLQSLTLLYKNGNPRYTGADKDYGTNREWGNTVYHGIKSIFFSDKAFLPK